MNDDEYCDNVERQVSQHFAKCCWDDLILKVNDITVAFNDFNDTVREKIL